MCGIVTGQISNVWCKNILSTEKLRKQYDALYMKAFAGLLLVK